MIEFMLSRLTMSICAIIVLLTLAPVVCSLPWATESSNSYSSFEQLAFRFQEVANAPGEASIEIALSDYLEPEGEQIVVRQGSLWLIGHDIQEARQLPTEFEIYVRSNGAEVKADQAQLCWASSLILRKSILRNATILEAHIENFEATS